jgi:serine acetyltransferase
MPLEHPGAELVHDVEPGHAQKQRHARQPQAEQQQVAPRKLKPLALSCRRMPSTPPAVLGSAAVPMQGRETAAREQRQDESRGTQQRVDPRARIGQRLFLVHQPARIGQHDGKQIGGPPEQK